MPPSIRNFAFLGRVIVGGFFLTNGFNHFAQLKLMGGSAKSIGDPAPELAVGGSGVLLCLMGTEPTPRISPNESGWACC